MKRARLHAPPEPRRSRCAFATARQGRPARQVHPREATSREDRTAGRDRAHPRDAAESAMTLSRSYLEAGQMRRALRRRSRRASAALTDERLSASLTATLAERPKRRRVDASPRLRLAAVEPAVPDRGGARGDGARVAPRLLPALRSRRAARRSDPVWCWRSEPGGVCRGVAYRLPAPLAMDELHLLWRREIVVERLSPALGEAPVGRAAARCAAPSVVRRDHVQYAPLAHDQGRRRSSADACGAFGSSCDYLMRTRAALAAHGIIDGCTRRISPATSRCGRRARPDLRRRTLAANAALTKSPGVRAGRRSQRPFVPPASTSRRAGAGAGRVERLSHRHPEDPGCRSPRPSRAFPVHRRRGQLASVGADPSACATACASHDEVARAVVAGHGGTVVKMTGDGMHARVRRSARARSRGQSQVCSDTLPVAPGGFALARSLRVAVPVFPSGGTTTASAPAVNPRRRGS